MTCLRFHLPHSTFHLFLAVLAALAALLLTGCGHSPTRAAGSVSLSELTMQTGATITITVSDSRAEAAKVVDASPTVPVAVGQTPQAHATAGAHTQSVNPVNPATKDQQ